MIEPWMVRATIVLTVLFFIVFSEELSIHDEINAAFDRFISAPEAQRLMEMVARRWLGNDERAKRIEMNTVIYTTLKATGIDPNHCAAFTRGFSAGLNAAMNVYRGNIDA